MSTASAIRGRLPQASLSAPEFGLLRWKMDREAGLAAKKEKLKTQQLLVEKLQAASDEVRVESQTIKAEAQALERTVATRVENLAVLGKENEKSKFQLNQVHKVTAAIASFNLNLEFLAQRQLSSQQEMTNQLAQLRLEHGSKVRAAREAREKEKEDFENKMKLVEAERKLLVENIENDKLILKKKEEEKMLMETEANSLASNTAQLAEQLELQDREFQVLEEKDLLLSEEERKLEALSDDLKTSWKGSATRSPALGLSRNVWR